MGIAVGKISELLRKLSDVPKTFHLHPKLGHGLQRRCEMADGKVPLDWAAAEALALASLADDGVRIRLTGQHHEPQGRGADHAALEQRVVGPRDRLRALTPDFVKAISPRYAADGKEAVHREAVLDARGMAQVMVLFDDPSHPPPVLVAHELTLTDGAGHDYGPHGDGLRTAIAETDRRLGQVLDMLEAKGLLDSTLFVFTSDHGMAAQDVTLKANPARHPERIGMKTRHRRADDLAARPRGHRGAGARRPHRTGDRARQRRGPLRRMPAGGRCRGAGLWPCQDRVLAKLVTNAAGMGTWRIDLADRDTAIGARAHCGP